MSFDVLDVINDATKEADAFENHPGKHFSLEEQLLYLQGLALVMNADGDVHDSEKEYLRILIKSFEMDEAVLDNLVEFAQKPDKDTVQDFFRKFRRRTEAQLFLFDAFAVSRRDGQVHEKETAVIHKMADQLEILKGTQSDIYDLYCHIKNRNWQESAIYFTTHLLNPDHFKHVLEYNEISYEALEAETQEIRRQRLQEIIKRRWAGMLDAMTWEPLTYCNDYWASRDDSYFKPITEREAGDTQLQIMTNRVSMQDLLWGPDVLLPFLQSMHDKGLLRVQDDAVYSTQADQDGNKVAYVNLKQSNVAFDKESCCFYVDKNVDGEKSPPLSEACVIDFLRMLMGDQFSLLDVLTLNELIHALTGCVLAYGKKYDSGDSDICFPQSGGSYMHEVVISYGRRLVRNKDQSSYSSSPALYSRTPATLMTEQEKLFRLVRGALK